jgi:hypothetical protein
MVGKKVSKTKKVTEVTLPVTEQVIESIPPVNVEVIKMDQPDLTQNKQVIKPGRTIIVKSKNSQSVALSSLDGLEGLESKTEINQHNSVFLVFDTIAHSEQAFNSLSIEYNVKFSYYKVFVSLTSNISDDFIDKTKMELEQLVLNNTGSTILFIKFYSKNNSYMNCGYFVVDTIDAMKKLISKESEFKQFKTESLTGTFYRFNNSKYKGPES